MENKKENSKDFLMFHAGSNHKPIDMEQFMSQLNSKVNAQSEMIQKKKMLVKDDAFDGGGLSQKINTNPTGNMNGKMAHLQGFELSVPTEKLKLTLPPAANDISLFHLFWLDDQVKPPGDLHIQSM